MKLKKLRPSIATLLFFFNATIANAGETSTGEATSGATSTSTRKYSTEMKTTSCPPALTEWVNDDFTDKSTLKIFDFPSEAKSCQTSVRGYEEAIKRSGKKTTLSDSESMSNYLADQYKQISPNAKNILNMCNSLTDGKDKIVKARYYMAMSKMEAVNSTVLDEMAYIDSVLPANGRVTTSLTCNSIFPFPQVGKKCEEYQKILNGSCKQSQDDRLNALVEKTKVIMGQVDELQKVYFSNCRSSNSPTQVCQNLTLAIQLLKNEAPWIDGKKFQDKANNAIASPFWSQKLKDETFKKGIIDQLAENRKAYLKQYNTNLQQAQCLTYSTHDNKAPCSFEDTRQYISQLPDVVEPNQPKSREATEFNSYVTAEKCMIDRGLDRERTKKVIDDAVTDMAITISTAGIGAAANGGLKIVKGMSSVAKLKNIAFADAALAAGNLTSGVRQAMDSCKKTSQNFLKFSGKPDVLKSNLCPESTSNFNIAESENTNCLVDALLTATDVWPLVKGLKIASGLSKFTNEDLLKLYKNPSQRAEIEKILSKNGNLSDLERTDAAEKLLGRKLSDNEKSCILSAHNIASDKVYNTTANVEAGLSVLSSSDLRAKSETLSGCGIASAEASLLMRSGITGNAGSSQTLIQTNYERARTMVSQRSSSAEGYGSYSLLADSAKALGKDSEATTAYQNAYKILAEKSGLSKATSSTQVQKILDGMSSREIMDLSDFAAGSGKTDLLSAIEKRRLQAIEQEATYGIRKNSLESIQAARESSNQAYQNYIDSLKAQARSTNPLTKKMGEARLKALGL